MDLPEVSILCRESAHQECGHWVGPQVKLWGRGRRHPNAILCQCACHSACPVTGRLAPDELWNSECSCPGAARFRGSREV
jgi:hypothetical protein